MAQAKPNPSYVDVPRPSSSMIINEFSVALLKLDVKISAVTTSDHKEDCYITKRCSKVWFVFFWS